MEGAQTKTAYTMSITNALTGFIATNVQRKEKSQKNTENLREQIMTAHRYTFYIDKSTNKQYFDKENYCLKGVKVEICRNTKLCTVEEQETRYKVVWYDRAENGWGMNGVKNKIRRFWISWCKERGIECA